MDLLKLKEYVAKDATFYPFWIFVLKLVVYFVCVQGNKVMVVSIFAFGVCV